MKNNRHAYTANTAHASYGNTYIHMKKKKNHVYDNIIMLMRTKENAYADIKQN